MRVFLHKTNEINIFSPLGIFFLSERNPSLFFSGLVFHLASEVNIFNRQKIFINITVQGSLRTGDNAFVICINAVSYTHLRAHETRHDLVCRLLLEKKKNKR